MVDVHVAHKETGLPLQGLSTGDFTILDQRTPSQVKHVSIQRHPLAIVMLFDLTDTVRPVLRQLRERAATVLNKLTPEDQVAVMVYSAQAELLLDFTNDRERILSAIRKASSMKSKQAAFFNEAVYQAANQLSKVDGSNYRRTILWLTDNYANSPSPMNRWASNLDKKAVIHTQDEAYQAVYSNNISIFAVKAVSKLVAPLMAVQLAVEAPTRGKYPAGNIHEYTARTGGLVLSAGKSNVEAKIEELLDAIRSRYVVGFRPAENTKAGEFRKIEVGLSRQDANAYHIRARQGYMR